MPALTPAKRTLLQVLVRASSELRTLGQEEGMMLNRFFSSIVLVGFVGGFSFAADEFALLKEEQIGNLRMDLSEKEVKKRIDCQLKRGPEEFAEYDGQYHQSWEYPDCGITLGMVSEKKGHSKSIDYIEVTSPCTLQTKRGIRIGSTEQEVIKAYGRDRSAENSKPGEYFVAGSIYGGVVFDFHNGRVSKIVLGATAE